MGRSSSSMLETFELNDARGKEPEGSRLTELESISVNMRRRPGASANSIDLSSSSVAKCALQSARYGNLVTPTHRPGNTVGITVIRSSTRFLPSYPSTGGQLAPRRPRVPSPATNSAGPYYPGRIPSYVNRSQRKLVFRARTWPRASGVLTEKPACEFPSTY